MTKFSARDKNFFRKIIEGTYAKFLCIEIEDVQVDSLSLKMPLSAEKHGNSYGFVHGGVIMSLADTTMGCACFNLGRRVTTLDLNINFLKSAEAAGYLKAKAALIHNGKRTLVVECEIYDDKGVFVAKARGTFFVVGEVG